MARPPCGRRALQGPGPLRLRITLYFIAVFLLCIPVSFCSCGKGGGGEEGTSLPEEESSWQVSLGSEAEERGHCVVGTPDGGYAVLGDRSQPGSEKTDFYLLKVDRNGKLEWERTFGGEGWERGYSLALTPDGGFILAGDTDSFGAGSCDAFLVKTNADGNRSWWRTYGGSGYDWAYSVLVTDDGGFLVVGQTESYGSPPGVFLLRTDPSGEVVWQKKVDLGGASLANCLEADPQGGYVLCGWVIQAGRRDMEAFLLRVGENGDLLWSKCFGGEGDDWASCARTAPGGGYLLAGGTTSKGAGKYDAYLVMTDERGEPLWERTFGGEGDDYGHGVCVLKGMGFALAGSVWSAGSGEDAYLAVTDGKGHLSWERSFGGEGKDWAYSVLLAEDGDLVLVGGSNSRAGMGEDVFLVKVSAGDG